MSHEVSYRHAQTYTVLWIIVLITLAVSAPLTFREGGDQAWLATALLVAFMGATLLLLGRLVIEVRRDAVHWHFGYIGWPAWSVPLTHIASVQIASADVVYGSGIKRRGQHAQYNTVIRGPALRLHLHAGGSITLGTPEPQRLQGFIEPRLAGAQR